MTTKTTNIINKSRYPKTPEGMIEMATRLSEATEKSRKDKILEIISTYQEKKPHTVRYFPRKNTMIIEESITKKEMSLQEGIEFMFSEIKDA